MMKRLLYSQTKPILTKDNPDGYCLVRVKGILPSELYLVNVSNGKVLAKITEPFVTFRPPQFVDTFPPGLWFGYGLRTRYFNGYINPTVY